MFFNVRNEIAIFCFRESQVCRNVGSGECYLRFIFITKRLNIIQTETLENFIYIHIGLLSFRVCVSLIFSPISLSAADMV
jgi:hypothetical protein